MSPVTTAAVTTITAALIAAGVSLLSLVIAKENKISEFRQAWIDSLRAEFSNLMAHLYAFHVVVVEDDADCIGAKTKTWSKAREDLIGVNRALTSIRLRLNPAEHQHQVVLVLLAELEQSVKDIEMRKATAILEGFECRLAKEVQPLLKAEWNRVRDGEIVFRKTVQGARKILFVGVCVAIVCLGCWIFRVGPFR